MNIEYFDDTHEYLVDGVLVPSVSKLVNYATGNIYSNIPSAILRRSAEYGTKIHTAIEVFESTGQIPLEEDSNEALLEWMRIKEENKIQVINMEQMVATKDYAGRYDILALVDGELTLIDIKTTSQYHKRNLEIQEGLYINAMEDDVVSCACVWLPKNAEGQFIEVEPISKEECKEIVDAFKGNLDLPEQTNDLEGTEIYSPAQVTKIKLFYSLKDEIEEMEKNAKAHVMKLMKEKGIKSFENDDFKITYVEPSTKTVVDQAKLKEDGLFDEYSKKTSVKESVRITPKWLKAKEQKH